MTQRKASKVKMIKNFIVVLDLFLKNILKILKKLVWKFFIMI